MLLILTMECLIIVLQYLFLITVGSVLIIKVFFGFKMHTDVFPFFPQSEHANYQNSTIIGLLLIN
jgi:hypothetical protein